MRADARNLLIGANGLTLPIEVAGETISVLAKKGAGKTYTGALLAEQLSELNIPSALIDVTSSMWGLRSSADGKAPGIPIVIFGGEHADVPLDPTAGAALADLFVDEKISMILDIAEFTVAEQHRFVWHFAERLYHRKSNNRNLVHLIIDEADEFAPQDRGIGGEVLKMLGALDRIVRRGRSRGIGVTLITQRSAVLNKNLLTQSDTLILLQTTAPQDIAAIDSWIKRNATPETRDKVLNSLPRLQRGQAWIWNPGLGILELQQIKKRWTFDSSATPKAGERVAAPKITANVDLEALRERFAATIDRAKADDPKALRARIAELEKQLRERPQIATEPERVEVRVEVPVLPATVADDLRAIMTEGGKLFDRFVAATDQVGGALDRVARPQAAVVERPRPRSTPTVAAVPRSSPAPMSKASGQSLKAGMRRMLDVLARSGGSLSKQQLATLADVNRTSGTFSDYLGSLRQQGFIEDDARAATITAAGADAIGQRIRHDPLRTDEIVGMFRPKLKAGAQRMLDLLVDAYPDAISKMELAERSQVNRTSGTFSDYLGSMRKNGLIDDDSREVRASATLFMKARV